MQQLLVSFKDLEVSILLDAGAAKMFISSKLIHQVTDHQVVQHAAADMLQIWLPNSEEGQNKVKVTLEANTKKL